MSVCKVYSDADNFSSPVAVGSLNFVHVVQGTIELTCKSDGKPTVLSLSSGDCIDPQNLREKKVQTVERMEVKQLSRVVFVSNADYRALVDVSREFV